MAGKLKFTKKTETIKNRGSKKQGLKGNKVKLAGNKKKKAPKQEPNFKYLKGTGSSFPGEKNDDVFAKMARGDLDQSFDSESIASSASSDMRGKGNKDFDMESLSSGSTGRYSGSSLGSSGSSIPLDKSFDILKEEEDFKNPYGLSDQQAEEAEKQDILARLHAMRSRGIRLSKNYTMRSSLPELRMEMGRIEHEQETQRSVQRLRRWLLAGVSGAQYATNSKFAPKFAKGKLNGFSDYVLGSIEDYDTVFERMSERYGGVIGIGSTGNPMVDLLMLMGTQMLMFIFMQHKTGVKPPTEEEIRKEHPDMVRRMALKMAGEMRAEEKRQEQNIRAQEMVRLQQEYQQSSRHSMVPPGYTAPDMQRFQSMPQQRTNMPGPSIQLELPSRPVPTEQVDKGAADMYDLLAAPTQDETVVQLHESTAPETAWIPEDLDHSKGIVVEEPQENHPPLPQYDRVLENTYPVAPKMVSKMVEMPQQKGISTRKGKPVKINEIQKIPPSPPATIESKDGGNVLSIS